MIDLNKLYEPFPPEQVSWRAQTLTKDGKKALALAYIDARDVMRRLDDVFGTGGWQCRYSHVGQITVCEISCWVPDDSGDSGSWITKANGAGATDVEGEKGACSDAFKRAAVLWGIGQYLYDFDATWAPCESWQDQGGKWRWSNWIGNPADHARHQHPKLPNADKEMSADDADRLKAFRKAIPLQVTVKALDAMAKLHADFLNGLSDAGFAAFVDPVRAEFVAKRDELNNPDRRMAG